VIHPCNYIFIRPESSAELERRLIRDVERMESYSSIALKKSQMEHDMVLAPGLDFINKYFVVRDNEQLLKEAPSFVMHKLYQF
jgi:hypothetical protein